MAAYSGERGWRRTRYPYSQAAPAAGVDWTITVPAGRLWRVIGVLATLTTAAAVATRVVRLQATDGNATYLDLAPAATQVISLVRVYQWAQGLQPLAIGGNITGALPDVVLQPGSILRVTTDAINAADQWSAPVVYVEETLVQSGPYGLDDIPDMVVEIAGWLPPTEG